MRRALIITALALGVPAAAMAHVTVRPRESTAGADERYTVRVPAEGQIATVSLELEVPEGVTVLGVPSPADAKHDVRRQGNRIVAIVWTREIKPGESAEFTFVARNLAEGSEIVWKAHQRYADGTASDWVNPPGQRSSAPVTKLVPGTPPSAPAAIAGQTGSDAEAARIVAWLKAYDEAFNARDLNRLARFCHPDVTSYEGGGINNGWADYRDHHLGPEPKSFGSVQFATTDVRVGRSRDPCPEPRSAR